MPNEPEPSLDPDDARERLDEVEDHIQAARRQAHEDLDHHEQPTFASSGDTPEEDDQTIAPPG